MDKSEFKNFWVYIEHDGKKAADVSLELLCEVRRLADESGEKLIAVIAGALSEDEIERIEACGTDGIIFVSGTGYARYNTEAYTNLFTVLCEKYRPAAVFVCGTVNGRDFAPRFAVRLNTGCTSDATELIYNPDTRDIEFVEPAAGGKIMAVITFPAMRPQIGTLRPGTFKYAPAGKRGNVEIIREEINFLPEDIRSELLSFKADEFDEELDIADTDCLVCVGAGLKEESLPKYKELAQLLGGKLGCTRPVADEAILPQKLQVGQSGVMIKTRLYIGFGVSGAVNHVTGISADKFIAVNRDASAPIFNYCDYGIVGDMDEVCEAMLAALKS